MTYGALYWLAAIFSCSAVVMVAYAIIFTPRKRKIKTYTMHDVYRDGAVSPSGSEWTTGTCEGCKKVKPLHSGYGQCYACIHNAD